MYSYKRQFVSARVVFDRNYQRHVVFYFHIFYFHIFYFHSCRIVCYIFVLLACGRGGKEAKLRRSENDKLFRDGIGILIDHSIETLARQRIQLLTIERYGVTNTSKWDAEIQHFIDKVLFPYVVAKDKVLIPFFVP
ncbi:MAG: hypothetical protein WBE14_17845 [Xanthobacteraceae bacterium]